MMSESLSRSVLIALALVLCTHTLALAQIVPGDTIRVTNGAWRQTRPSISGDVVVWQDYRTGQGEIYGYNLATGQEFAVATGESPKAYPEIDGSLVMWTEAASSTNRQIYCKDLATGTVYTVESGAHYCDEYYSAVGRTVYYSARRRYGQSQAIYSYHLDTGLRTLISLDDGWSDRYPQGKDGYVAWHDYFDVGLFNIERGEFTRVDVGIDVHEVAVAQGRVGFLSSYTSNIVNIYSIEEQSLESYTLPMSCSHPSMDGNIMVLTANYPADRVLGLDVTTGDMFDVVVTGPAEVLHTQRCLEIDDMRVAWVRGSNGSWDEADIYVTELVPEPATISLVVLGLGALLVRRRQQ